MIEEKSNDWKRIEIKLEKQKLKRLFQCWKQIKMRKMAFLKKFLKRKKKADDFMKIICITKWKMNIRAVQLHRMASEIFLSRPKVNPLPMSRKGLDLAYQRVHK